MRNLIFLVLFVATLGVLGACTSTATDVKPAPNVAPSPVAPVASPAVSTAPNQAFDSKAPGVPPSAKAISLEGSWPGLEGTSLNLSRKDNKFTVEIKKGEKTETFQGFAKGDDVQFKRNDKLETIKAVAPEETGMKWPGGEKNCVVITKGSEAFCRK